MVRITIDSDEGAGFLRFFEFSALEISYSTSRTGSGEEFYVSRSGNVGIVDISGRKSLEAVLNSEVQIRTIVMGGVGWPDELSGNETLKLIAERLVQSGGYIFCDDIPPEAINTFELTAGRSGYLETEEFGREGIVQFDGR